MSNNNLKLRYDRIDGVRHFCVRLDHVLPGTGVS
jgi:hypothetical protein